MEGEADQVEFDHENENEKFDGYFDGNFNEKFDRNFDGNFYENVFTDENFDENFYGNGYTSVYTDENSYTVEGDADQVSLESSLMRILMGILMRIV